MEEMKVDCGLKLMLSDLFNFDDEDLKDWCICLNNQDVVKTYSLNKGEEERNKLLNHMGYKKDHKSCNSFRIIDKKCLQFVRLDRDKKSDQWLFIGAFEQVGEHIHKYPDGGVADIYDLKKLDKFNKFDERLVVRYKKHSGDKQAKIKLENIFTMDIVKLLDGYYESELKNFEGYSNISLSFREMKQIMEHSDNGQWQKPLSRINGIYVVTDTFAKKLYIGSTYGDEGVWQRWSVYVKTCGTGGNVMLDELISIDQQYAFNNFTFTLIECYIKNKGNEKFILGRETYWKEVFLTRDSDRGYNKN